MADSRLVMNLKGIGMALIPRFFFQSSLKNILADIAKSDDRVLEEMVTRVNYYNKFTQSIKKSVLGCDEKERIGKLPFKKTSLAFDAYIVSKYFDDNLFWIKKYGDINYILQNPSICKDRPISNNNANNVLLKLDKNRHFIYLDDTREFSKKKDLAIFRGACYQPLRQKFMNRHYSTPGCDVGDTSRNDTPWKKPPIDKKIQIENKFIISLEGNTFASNLNWAMSSNSLVIAPKMTNETWLMEGQLIPNYHYAMLNDDFENLEEIIEYYKAHPKDAEEIIENAHRYLKKFLCEKKEFQIGILVLAKYFYLSEQMDLPQDILSLFNIKI